MCKRLPVEQKLDKKEALAIRSIAVTKDGVSGWAQAIREYVGCLSLLPVKYQPSLAMSRKQM
ncbi:hypothetical protein SFC43_26680 [Bacteroides sp. CR5/BHMF/2]|nr:hypothetical protein [Bacteroides sp. CR5/BHMF/2]